MRATRALAYVAAGALWLLADFVTWRRHGLLTSSTLADVAPMLRLHELNVSGAFVVPIAVMPLAGAAVIGLALWHHQHLTIPRIAVAVAGLASAATLVVGLGRGGIDSFGLGAWSASLGFLCALVGVGCDHASVIRWLRNRRAPEL